MINVKITGLPRLIGDLGRIATQAVPYAARETLNNSAFALQKEWRSDVKRTFTLRNQYTAGAIRVDKATGTNVSTMQASTGSVAKYAPDQERGKTDVRGPVPAPAAAGNAPGSNKRTRLTRSRFRFGGLGVTRVGNGYGKRRQNAVALAVATRKGQPFVLLNRKTGRGLGIFELKGNKRGAHLRLIWSVKQGAMTIKPEPTLQRSIDASMPAFEAIQQAAFTRQLKRNKVFGY